MSIINREYYAGVDEFKQPRTVIDQEAIGARILNLCMMEKQNYLHLQQKEIL